MMNDAIREQAQRAAESVGQFIKTAYGIEQPRIEYLAAIIAAELSISPVGTKESSSRSDTLLDSSLDCTQSD